VASINECLDADEVAVVVAVRWPGSTSAASSGQREKVIATHAGLNEVTAQHEA
jgi:hypothetical protein